MKKFILMICAALLAEAGSIAQVIESDYKKVFVCDVLSIDVNQDGELGRDELYDAKSYVSIDYRDYGSAGSLLTIATLIEKEDGSTESFGNNFEDVKLINIPAGMDGDNQWALLCKDALDDTLFMIFDVADVGVEGYSKMFCINNLAILR